MSTIPASAIVNVLPNVINAGGNALVLNGMMLTQTPLRVPSMTVQPFATAAAVGAYFGLTSNEYAKALSYFNSYQFSTQIPGNLFIVAYPQNDLAAWIQSGPINTLTVAQVAAITGSLNLTIDGYVRTIPSLNLSAATSYTAAATVLQTALNASLPTEATFTTANIAQSSTTNFNGTISDDVLTVSGTVTGTIQVGGIISGVGVSAGTQITNQLSGPTGGVGTYSVSIMQNVPSTTISETYGVLTVTTIATGTVSPGQTLAGGTTAAGTIVTAYGSGTGLNGTYIVNLTQTVSSVTSAMATPVSVSFDSISGSFYIVSGALGAAGGAQFATGTAAASLFLTAPTGAILSQGQNSLTPQAFMTGLTQLTQNWATFFLATDPDNGLGNAQKLAFAAWTSSMNNRYGFICWDTDITATQTVPATTSLGYLINTIFNYSGTTLIYDPNNLGHAAFISGYGASLNFQAINGRTTAAFRDQSSIQASVTNQQVAANLLSNGYNFVGAYATANQGFIFFYNGSVSGPFLWLDSYLNQIFMNAEFQLDLMELLTNVNSIPYNAAGYAMIENALIGTIQQMISFGAIRTGVNLSQNEIITVNNQAGFAIDSIITNQGWYMQVQPASPQVRQARTSPVCFFWYADGQSVQQITLNSIELV